MVTATQVFSLDPNTALLAQWPNEGSVDWGDGTYASPTDIAVGTDGTLVVLVTANEFPSLLDAPLMSAEDYLTLKLSETFIKTYDAQGNFHTAWGQSGSEDWQFRSSGDWAVTVGPEGSVYVLDSGMPRVKRFSSDGTFLGAWGASGEGPGEFREPQGIAVGPDGTVYVSDTENARVQRFDADGTFLTTWGTAGSEAGQFSSPTAVAVGPDGSVYVVDRGNDRIQRFTSDGAFLGEFGDRDAFIQDVAVTSRGTVYVAYASQDEDGSGRAAGNLYSYPGDGVEGYCTQPLAQVSP